MFINNEQTESLGRPVYAVCQRRFNEHDNLSEGSKTGNEEAGPESATSLFIYDVTMKTVQILSFIHVTRQEDDLLSLQR